MTRSNVVIQNGRMTDVMTQNENITYNGSKNQRDRDGHGKCMTSYVGSRESRQGYKMLQHTGGRRQYNL